MGSELKTIEQNPADLIRISTDVAGVCKTIVLKTACQISGKKYVKVEGWQAIATAHGCILGSREVTRIEGGVRAIGELRRISDGVILATAEGFIGDDEPVWAKRPEYAKRAMAQTRGMSRVARSAFAHVVVMMDAGLETTPAEEIPQEGFDRVHQNESAAVTGQKSETAEEWSIRQLNRAETLDQLDACVKAIKEKGFFTEKVRAKADSILEGFEATEAELKTTRGG